MYLHLLGKAVRHTGFGVDDFVHERLSQAGVVQLIVAPAQGIKGDYYGHFQGLMGVYKPLIFLILLH